MLKHQLLVRILLLRRFHQLGKVVVVGLVRLTPSGYKLNLLTSMPTNTDCTGEVLPQILLVPLGNYGGKEIGLTFTRCPFFEYA